MYLSAQSNAYLKKVLLNDELMQQGACTGAMRAVMDHLGRGPGVAVNDFNPAQDGMYSVVLNFGGDINTPEHDMGGWEHGLALQKLGEEIVLYQAWVGVFTLGDWLLTAQNVSALPSAPYSPLHAKCSEAGMKTWLGMLKQLGGLAKGNFVAFKATCDFLFGPPTGHVGTMQLNLAGQRNSPLRYHWKYAPMKAIADVE